MKALGFCHMLRVLLCIFVRMLPGTSHALELILAENHLPAGSTDNQGAGAKQGGTSLPLGCGVCRLARADPRAVSGQMVSPEVHRAPEGLVSRLVWGLRV